MDLMLRDGDLLPGADGQPLTVTGLAELRQRVMIRLCSRRSGFEPYPELGSELYHMNRADQERIRAAVEEALCPLTGVTVLSVEPVPGHRAWKCGWNWKRTAQVKPPVCC